VAERSILWVRDVGQPTIGSNGRPIGEYIVVTCYLRYVLDPFKLKEFEIYGKTWIPLVEKFGGKHHGYFMPSEGMSNVALALFTFPSLAAYEVYRTKAAQDPDCQAAMRYYEETKCFLSFERSFFRPVFS
jgi:NIPSNAP